MSDENVSRRKFLASAAAAGVTGSVSVGEAYRVEIYLDRRLAERSEAEGYSRSRAAEVFEEVRDGPLNQITQHTSIDSFHTGYLGEVEGIRGETAPEALHEWKRKSNTDAGTAIVLTNDDYERQVGRSEKPKDSFRNAVGVVGEAYDLLELEPSELSEKVLLLEYNLVENAVEINYTPEKTAVSGIHEFGHTLGLGHDAGKILRERNETVLTVMKNPPKELDEGSVDAPAYWRSDFSQSEIQKIDSILS